MAQPRSVRPAVLLVTTVLSLLLGGAVVAGVFVWKPMVRDRVIAEARERGIVLEPGDVDVWFGSASLHDVRFSLLGVPGVAGSAATIDVVLDGLSPRQVNADGVRVELTGTATDLVVSVTEWAKNYPQALASPIQARNIALTLRSRPGEAPWLEVGEGQLTDRGSERAFTAKTVSVVGFQLSGVNATWSASRATASLKISGAAPDSPPLQVEVAHASTPPTATVTLPPTPLSELSGPLGLPEPVLASAGIGGRVIVSASAEMAFSAGFEKGPIHGRLATALDGFVPPHPVELDGFVFGNRTTFTSTFAVSADRDTVTLSDAEIAAGAFKLRGGGRITHEGDHAVAALDFAGSLRCTDVAASAAQARLGTVLGRLLGNAAKRVLEGSVAIRVRVDADTRKLEAARIERQIGVGCGLSPLKIRDLAALGLEQFEELVSDMPSVRLEGGKVKVELPPPPPGLPPLPSGLPELPKGLPGLPFELKFGGPGGADAK